MASKLAWALPVLLFFVAISAFILVHREPELPTPGDNIVKSVEVSISPSCKSGTAGETVGYFVMIKNTGNIEDDYRLESNNSLGWSTMLSENELGEVQPSENRTIGLSIVLPENASGRNYTLVTVTSARYPSVSDNCWCAVDVLPKSITKWDDICWSVGTEFIITGGVAKIGEHFESQTGYTSVLRVEEENSEEVLWVRTLGGYIWDRCSWNKYALLPEFITPISGELIPQELRQASPENIESFLQRQWPFEGKIKVKFQDGSWQELQFSSCRTTKVQEIWICTRFENEDRYTDMGIPTVCIEAGPIDHPIIKLHYAPQLNIVTFIEFYIENEHRYYALFKLLGVVNQNEARPALLQPYFPINCQFAYNEDNLIDIRISTDDPTISHFTLKIATYSIPDPWSRSIYVPRTLDITRSTVNVYTNGSLSYDITVEAKDEENGLVGAPVNSDIWVYSPTPKKVGVILPKNGDYCTPTVLEAISAYLESIREDPYLAELGIREGNIFLYEGGENVEALDEFIENLFHTQSIGYFIIVGEDFIGQLATDPYSLWPLYHVYGPYSSTPGFVPTPSDIVISFIVCPPQYSLPERRNIMESIFSNYANFHLDPARYLQKYTLPPLYLCDLAVCDFIQPIRRCVSLYDSIKIPNFDHVAVERELKRKPVITHVRAHGSSNTQGIGLNNVYTTLEEWKTFCKQHGTPSPIITVSACYWSNLEGWPGTYLESGVLAYFEAHDFNYLLHPLGERVRANGVPTFFFGDPLAVLVPTS